MTKKGGHFDKLSDRDKQNDRLFEGCDVGLEPTTPRTTIWCSTN